MVVPLTSSTTPHTPNWGATRGAGCELGAAPRCSRLALRPIHTLRDRRPSINRPQGTSQKAVHRTTRRASTSKRFPFRASVARLPSTSTAPTIRATTPTGTTPRAPAQAAADRSHRPMGATDPTPITAIANTTTHRATGNRWKVRWRGTLTSWGWPERFINACRIARDRWSKKPSPNWPKKFSMQEVKVCTNAPQ